MMAVNWQRGQSQPVDPIAALNLMMADLAQQMQHLSQQVQTLTIAVQRLRQTMDRERIRPREDETAAMERQRVAEEERKVMQAVMDMPRVRAEKARAAAIAAGIMPEQQRLSDEELAVYEARKMPKARLQQIMEQERVAKVREREKAAQEEFVSARAEIESFWPPEIAEAVAKFRDKPLAREHPTVGLLSQEEVREIMRREGVVGIIRATDAIPAIKKEQGEPPVKQMIPLVKQTQAAPPDEATSFDPQSADAPVTLDAPEPRASRP